VGTEVLGELGEQRETLLRSQARLENANDGLSKSRQVIRMMRRNVLYNKIILIMIIVLEAFILAALLFIKFFKK
jgi:vesicle transport through interaction with t-SNAREs 1